MWICGEEIGDEYSQNCKERQPTEVEPGESSVQVWTCRFTSQVFCSFYLILFHFSVKFDAKISGMADSEPRILVSNRKARHDYEILETLEAGIALKGTEVKSLRKGNANLQDGYAVIKNGEVWLFGMHISPYDKGNINNHDPRRERRLLLHRKQIRKLFGRVTEKGLTLIPLSAYFKGPYAKIELAVARGKKSYDKREAIAKREAQRELSKRMKRSYT
jgi:SsrA-binding protein